MTMNEQLAFLAELQTELTTQTHDYQANPRFWVVMDYKNEPCWEGHAEFYEIVVSKFDLYGSLEEMKESLERNGYVEEVDEEDIKVFHAITDEEELVDWLQETLHIEAYIVPMKKVECIKKDTFFITKRACQNHIDANQHHYSKKAHTYAMTAWRSPQVEKLWNILETFDFQALREKTTL